MDNTPRSISTFAGRFKANHMKIAVLGTRGFPDVQGGVEAHCENLYPRLVRKGCEVVVFSRRPYVNSACGDYEGVRLIALDCSKNKFLETFLHTLYGVFVAKKLSPDILHFHAIGPSLFVPLARLLGLKVVMTNHGPDYQRKKWTRLAKLVLKLGEFLGIKFANGVIAISQTIADQIRRKYKKEVAVIPNGVVIAQIAQSDDVVKKYGLTKGKYILSVGRFVPEKGFHDLIDAYTRIYTERNTQINTDKETNTHGLKIRMDADKDWKLVITGDADHPDRYSQSLKEKASQNRNVILTGSLNGGALQELYSNAGLFVLPSYYEGLPIVLLEAMSYGLSCIASDIPPNREVGLSEERFFKPGDVKALAGKIKEFMDKPLTDEEKRRQIDMVAKKYNWEKIAAQTLQVYREVFHS